MWGDEDFGEGKGTVLFQENSKGAALALPGVAKAVAGLLIRICLIFLFQY